MTLTAPNNLNEDILKFCSEIDSTTKPIFVDVVPIEGYIADDCYGNVENYIKINGGKIRYGWIIWEDPQLFIEAEFHAVGSAEILPR